MNFSSHRRASKALIHSNSEPTTVQLVVWAISHAYAKIVLTVLK
jgi:hypothetical protein